MSGLTGFLDEVMPEPAPEPVEAREPEPERVEETQEPVETPERAEAPEPGEQAPEVPDDVRGLRAAVQATRKERNDYKGERDRLAGEMDAQRAAMDALKAELEAARKVVAAPPPPPPAPVQQAPVQQVPIPSPIEDPEGFAAYLQQRDEERDWINRCNSSQIAARRVYPDLDTKIEAFKVIAQKEPWLATKLRQEADPFEFAYQYVRNQEALAKIGSDPSAFEAKLEADLRTKIQAELEAKYAAQIEENAAQVVAEVVPRVEAAARPVIPTSLANARNAGTRSASTPTVPDFDSIFTPKKRG